MENVLIVIMIVLLAACITALLFFLSHIKKNNERILNSGIENLMVKNELYFKSLNSQLKDEIKLVAEFINKQMFKVEQGFQVTLNDITLNFDKLVSDTKKQNTEMSQSFTSNIDSITQNYNRFEKKMNIEYVNTLNKLNINVANYLTILTNVNKDLSIEIQELKENDRRIKQLLPQLETNYTVLEKISDKSKELISSHETTLGNHINNYESSYAEISNALKDRLTELSSACEVVLEQGITKTTESVTKLFDSSKEHYAGIIQSTESDFQLLINSVKDKINNELESFNIENLSKLVIEFNNKLSETIKSNKENTKTLTEQLAQQESVLADRIEALNKKKRFF